MSQEKRLEVCRIENSTPENLREHRAKALRLVLRSRAYIDKLVSYKWVMIFFGGLDRFEVARILGKMVEIDTNKKTNLTSARVVDLKSGKPNSGFCDIAKEMGFPVEEAGEDVFIKMMQGQVFNDEILV